MHDRYRTFATVEQQLLILLIIHAPPPQVRTDRCRGELNSVSISFGSTEPSVGTRSTEWVAVSATTKKLPALLQKRRPSKSTADDCLTARSTAASRLQRRSGKVLLSAAKFGSPHAKPSRP